jgi:hypothetical protein
MIECNRGHRPHEAAVTFADSSTQRGHRRIFRRVAFAGVAAFAAGAGVSAAASAAPISTTNFTIDFDLVKVTARAGPAGSTILSATALGNGPFATVNGLGPVDFDSFDSQGNETNLDGITTGQIVANFLSPRYFGSDAAPNGSIILNLTQFQFASDGTVEPGPGVDIGGFQISLTQPTIDNIVAADGGNAFSSVSFSSDKKNVTFSGGDIPDILYPAPGGAGDFLWSAITAAAQPPASLDVYFTTPTIPPDPNGEFADVRLIGAALAVPEPPSILVLLAGLLGVRFALRCRGDAVGTGKGGKGVTVG